MCKLVMYTGARWSEEHNRLYYSYGLNFGIAEGTPSITSCSPRGAHRIDGCFVLSQINMDKFPMIAFIRQLDFNDNFLF